MASSSEEKGRKRPNILVTGTPGTRIELRIGLVFIFSSVFCDRHRQNSDL